jgi:hypothetical protein
LHRNNIIKIVIVVLLCGILLTQTGCTKSENTNDNKNNMQGKIVGLSLIQTMTTILTE